MTGDARGGSMAPDERAEMLTALLDGELSESEAAEVRDWIDTSSEARRQFDDLARVRLALRDLPAVDPPDGFYESLLRGGPDGTIEPSATLATVTPIRRRRGPLALGAVAAVAACFVLILGITPASDRIVPPVEAFAARHDDMSRTGSAAGGSWNAIDEGALAAMPAAYRMAAATGGYRPVGRYNSGDVVHLVYADGPHSVSVYVQQGTVAWERLPDGSSMVIDDFPAWEARVGPATVVVIERKAAVYTVVSAEPDEQMMTVVHALPMPDDPSLGERLRDACAAFSGSFSFGS